MSASVQNCALDVNVCSLFFCLRGLETTKCVPFVIFVIQMVAHGDGANILWFGVELFILKKDQRGQSVRNLGLEQKETNCVQKTAFSSLICTHNVLNLCLGHFLLSSSRQVGKKQSI